MTKSLKPPVWFWVVSAIALIWNLAGVMAYLDQTFASDDLLSQMEKAVRNAIQNRPAWATAAFATAVWGGAVGSLLLLLRQRIAHIVLIISLIGIIIQMGYNYFIANNLSDYGPSEHLMSVMILGFGIGLVFFAKKAQSAKWLT